MITTISTLPSPPNRNDPGTFSDRADSFLGAMPTLVSELNNFVSEVNTLSFKTACKCATTTNITLSGTQTIDGVSAASGDRVLVKNQNSASQNGIYVVGSSTWTRAADMDTPAEIAGSFVPVTFGATQGGKIYYTTFNATGGVIGTTDIPWNSLTEGSITGIGTLAVANGGTGISSYAVGDIIYANGTSSLAKLASAVSGNVLKSGPAPSWGKVALTTDVSGTLPAGNGGTGLTSPGTSGNVLTSTGSGWTSSPVSIPSASTSAAGIVELATTAEAQTGTDTARAITPAGLAASKLVWGTKWVYNGTPTDSSIQFLDIPSWVKRITLMLSAVSINGEQELQVQVRRASDNTWITSNYVSMAGDYNGVDGSSNNFTGMLLTRSQGSGSLTNGIVTLTKISSDLNTWIYSGNIADNTVAVSNSAGRILMGTEQLNGIRLTSFGSTALFDSGVVNIMYE